MGVWRGENRGFGPKAEAQRPETGQGACRAGHEAQPHGQNQTRRVGGGKASNGAQDELRWTEDRTGRNRGTGKQPQMRWPNRYRMRKAALSLAAH